jgi:magnesium transporter
VRNPLLIPELRELLASHNDEMVRQFCEQNHPEMVVDLIGELDTAEIWQVLNRVNSTLRAEIFSYFDLDRQVELVAGQNRRDMARLLEEMSPDDRADLVQRLDSEIREQILPLVARAEREDIRKLVQYEQGTAGAVMSTDYAALRSEVGVSEAIEQLRAQAPAKETIYYVYVIDQERRLTGFVSLKDLITAGPKQTVADVMHTDVISVNVNDDQEEAASKIEKYDLIAVPVVDGANVLVGIITHDDALDIIRQEQTEDVEKLMAIGGHHEAGAYLKTSAWKHFTNRCGWIVILAILGFVSGFIVQRFEGLLIQFAVLATFMPMLADTGGNTGSQSATLVIRALALRELSAKDFLGVLSKELPVSILLGLLCAVLAFVRLLFLVGGRTTLHYSLPVMGLAVSSALALQVVTATLIGAILPLVAAKFRLDPAVIASPALTTIVDITGLLIFFSTAKLILHL